MPWFSIAISILLAFNRAIDLIALFVAVAVVFVGVDGIENASATIEALNTVVIIIIINVVKTVSNNIVAVVV